MSPRGEDYIHGYLLFLFLFCGEFGSVGRLKWYYE